VFDDRVVLVGRDTVAAYALEDGASLWTLKSSLPAGRGVATDDRYHLPLASGELWSIDLKDGKVAAKSSLPRGRGALGNLAMSQGMLLSLDPLQLTAFEQKQAIQSQIAARKEKNPRDAWALLREADIAALNRDFSAALSSLRQIDDASLPADLADRRHTLLSETLSAVVRSGTKSPADEAALLKELGDLAVTSTEKQAHQRLLAERHVARGEFVAAFDALLTLRDVESDELIAVDHQPAKEEATKP